MSYENNGRELTGPESALVFIIMLGFVLIAVSVLRLIFGLTKVFA
jgi:hypothetical protein